MNGVSVQITRCLLTALSIRKPRYLTVNYTRISLFLILKSRKTNDTSFRLVVLRQDSARLVSKCLKSFSIRQYIVILNYVTTVNLSVSFGGFTDYFKPHCVFQLS